MRKRADMTSLAKTNALLNILCESQRHEAGGKATEVIR
jgi:hypothetical protein